MRTMTISRRARGNVARAALLLATFGLLAANAACGGPAAPAANAPAPAARGGAAGGAAPAAGGPAANAPAADALAPLPSPVFVRFASSASNANQTPLYVARD